MSEDKKSLFDTIITMDDETFNALTTKVQTEAAQLDALMRSVDVQYQPTKPNK